MRRILLLTGALLASAGAAHAEDHQGFSVALGALQIDDATYTFTGGKPDQEISGTLPFFRVGYDHQFGEDGGLVLGASYFSTFGDGLQSPPVRDGNFLVQDGTLDSLSGWEVRAGWAFGNFLPYVSYGETEREGTTDQSCPNDPNAPVNVGGFCAGGFNLAVATQRAGERSGSVDGSAETLSLGIEWNATAHVFLDLRYSETDFGTQIVTLDPTGNTPGQVAHPATNPTQSISGLALSVGYRF